MVFAKGKKKYVLILLCAVCLILISCQESVSTKQLVAIEVKAHPTKVNYYEGEAFSSSGLRILGIYSDNTTQEITDFGVSIAEGVTLTGTGTQSVFVSYGGKTCSFSISVLEVKLISIAVKKMPEKTSYYLGDKFASYGLEIVAQYSNGSEKAITNYNLSIEDNAILDSLGTKTVTASYLNESVSFKIKTEMPELEKIVIKNLPNKLVYKKGDYFETTGLSVYAVYNNGFRVEVDDFTVSLNNNTKLTTDGTKAVSVFYEGKEVIFNIEVSDAELRSISITSLPKKLIYTRGECFDSSGIEVTGTYSDNTQKKIDYFDLSIANGSILKQEGSPTIEVHYSGQKASFNITVNKPTLVSISIKSLPQKTDYVEGDVLDLTGMVVVGVYSDTSTLILDEYYTDPALNTVLSKVGTREINVIQGGCSTSFNVYVREDTAIRYSRRYQSMGLARTINLITASNLMPTSGNKSIFDAEKLGRCEVKEQTIGSQPELNISGYSFSDFAIKLKTHFENKTSGSMDTFVMSGSADFGISLDLNFDFDHNTKEYYVKLSKYVTSYEIAIDEYRDVEKIASMLSQDFKDDALKVQNGTMSPEEFVRRYGTHVIMAAYIGGSVDVIYYCIYKETTSATEAKIQLKDHVTAELLFGGAATEELELDTSISLNTKNVDGSSQISIHPVGGDVIGFGDSIDGIREGFKTWSRSLNDDNMAVIDVPDGSLYCVWEFLDDSYSTAKRLLNNYFYSECEKQENSFVSKITEAKSASSVFFDETKNMLVFNLSSMGSKKELEDGLSYSGFDKNEDKLIIPPGFSGKRIESVKLIGSFMNDDENGRPVEDVLPLSIVFDSAWNNKGDITLILENLAIEAGDDNIALDFSEITTGIVTIKVVGNNKLSNSNPDSLFGIICGTDLKITGENDICTQIDKSIYSSASCDINLSGTLTVVGANGRRGKITQNEVDGKAAIECKNTLYIRVGADSHIYGGNGVQPGTRGQASGHTVTGKTGYNGGNGGAALQAPTIKILSNGLHLHGGNGGQGGTGGTGSYGVAGWDEGYNGGAGGTGGTGGNGGIPFEGTIIIDNSVSIINVYGGNGGKGGTGGAGGYGGTTSTGNLIIDESHWYGISGGNGGNGGAGGVSSLMSIQNSCSSSFVFSNKDSLVPGEGGDAGLGGAEGCAYSGRAWLAGDKYGTKGNAGKKGSKGAY